MRDVSVFSCKDHFTKQNVIYRSNKKIIQSHSNALHNTMKHEPSRGKLFKYILGHDGHCCVSLYKETTLMDKAFAPVEHHNSVWLTDTHKDTRHQYHIDEPWHQMQWNTKYTLTEPGEAACLYRIHWRGGKKWSKLLWGYKVFHHHHVGDQPCSSIHDYWYFYMWS